MPDQKSSRKPKTKPKTEIDVLHADSLTPIPWLVHGFSTRSGGFSKVYGGNALNLGFTAQDSRARVERNREAFAAAAAGARDGRTVWPMVTLRQIHSDLIHCVSDPPKHLLAGDGLITCTPEILLAGQTADCLPIILVDTKRRAVGVFHAGWRGTLKRIVEKGVGEMHRWFGTRPADTRAAIGPGIRRCCYHVGPEVRVKFESQFSYASALFRETKDSDEVRERYPLLFLSSRAPGHSELPKKIFLDLAEANRRQLLDAGVPAKNIVDVGLCTSCRSDLFFSHRAEKGVTGRMVAVVGIRD
jgi:purine-nucleoside/S-methyl-5'-thioadenosine phosphorylase / adenosine deaminase